MGDTSSSLTFYPPHLFKYSPTYTSWARLTAADLHHRLYRRSDHSGIAVDDLWYFTNHPIRWVRIVGIIIAFDEWEKRTQITVDDGSGELIDVVAWKTPSSNHGTKMETPLPNMMGVHLHAVVKVKGSIDEYRERKQMRLKKVEVIKDTVEEVRCWKEMVEWKRNVLMQPWILDAKTVRRAEKVRRREKRKFLERDQKRKKGGGEDGEEGRKKRGRMAEEEREFKGRRRPEGFRPPQPPRTRRSPTPPLADRQDSKTIETEDVDVEIGGVGKFRGRKRPPDYKPPPRPLISRSPSPDLCTTKQGKNDNSNTDFGARHVSPAVAGSRDVKNYSDLKFGGGCANVNSTMTKAETASMNREVRTERDHTDDVQEFRACRRPRGCELSTRSHSQLSPSPKPLAVQSDYSDLDFGGLPMSVSAKPLTAAKLEEDYSGMDFGGRPGSSSTGLKVYHSNEDAGTKNSTNWPGATCNSSAMADDSFRRRRVRIVPTEKFIPPPTQTQDITTGNDPPNCHLGSSSSDPPPPPAFKGRRRPGTVPSEPASQQSQGRSASQHANAIYEIRDSYTAIITPADPQPHSGRRRPGTAQSSTAASQAHPPQYNVAKKRNSTPTAMEHDSYTVRFSRPAQDPQPQPTFRGHRRTEPELDEHDLPPSSQQPPTSSLPLRPQWIEYTDDIPSTISTYNPTPTQPTYRGRRRAPSPRAGPRIIKAAILAHLRSTSASTVSSQSLFSTASIAALAPSAALVTSSLQALAADGYLLPTDTPDFWVIVSYQQLSDIIDGEAKSAMHRSRDRVVHVGRVWRQAGARGGHWAGVGKEVVGEILAGHFGGVDGWVEVKGGWEWRGA
jgi:hypothetical protein